MGAIGDALDTLAAELEAEGIPTVTDPALVSARVSELGAVAWVQPPETVDVRGVGGGRVVLAIPVAFMVHPWGVPDLSAVLDYLPAALIICRESAVQTTVSVGDLVFPAYRVLASRTITI